MQPAKGKDQKQKEESTAALADYASLFEANQIAQKSESMAEIN